VSEIQLVHFTFESGLAGREALEHPRRDEALAAGRASQPSAPRRDRAREAPFVARLRLAFAGGSVAATDTCTCPA
jgi:hypothetical protein